MAASTVKRRALLGGAAVVTYSAAAGGAWILSLPAAPAVTAAAPVDGPETAAALAALRPPKRRRPLVAVIGINDATEVTDYLMPCGILRRAQVADIWALATGAGPVRLYPALQAMPDATAAEFDARHPDGADYVIVPAMSRENDPAVLAWIRRQAGKGAVVVGVCAGARVVAKAGLLEDRHATTHWYYLRGMLDEHPSIRYVADRRFVIDRGVATTTGITASAPMMLTLIEAMAGRGEAEAVAADLGLAHWDARHPSAAFRLTRPFALTVIGNRLAVWRRETLGIALAPGIDEVSLALAADAWSRTYRSRAVSFAASPAPVAGRGGLRIVPDEVVPQWPAERRLPAMAGCRPAEVLDRTLHAIAARYGAGTADVVAMQLEYPWRPAAARVGLRAMAPPAPSG
jgi:putative intracellular protease/amidase